MEKYNINGKIGNNKWKFYNNIETKTGNLDVKVNLGIFEKINDFLWLNQLSNPLVSDADDQKLDSELAQAYFWRPNDYLKKKKEIGKLKKKRLDEENKSGENVAVIPSVYRRLQVSSTKIYLSYHTGFRLLVT